MDSFVLCRCVEFSYLQRYYHPICNAFSPRMTSNRSCIGLLAAAGNPRFSVQSNAVTVIRQSLSLHQFHEEYSTTKNAHSFGNISILRDFQDCTASMVHKVILRLVM